MTWEDHFRSSKRHFDLGLTTVPIVLGFKEMRKVIRQTSLRSGSRENTHKKGIFTPVYQHPFLN